MFGVENILSLIWRNSKMTITWSSNLTFGRNTLETLDFIWMACYLISQHEIPDLILMCDFFFVQMLGHYYLAVFWVALQSIQYCWAGIAKNMQIIACIWSGIFLEPPPKKKNRKKPAPLKRWLAWRILVQSKLQIWVCLYSRFYLEVQKGTLLCFELILGN